MPASLRRTAITTGVVAALISGCGPSALPAATGPVGSPTTTGPAVAAPTASPSAAVKPQIPSPSAPQSTGIPDDSALIVVSAVATAPNGAQLDVTLTLDTRPEPDAELLDEVLSSCYLKDDNWPRDVARAVLWVQTLRSIPVAGTPAWPRKQGLFLLTLAAHGVATGDGFTQVRTTSGASAMCSSPDANIRPRGPGSVRMVLLTSPSRALTSFGGDDILAMAQYGFATGFSPSLQAALSDCVVTVSPEIEAARAAQGQRWWRFDRYGPWDDGDYCGVGVPNDRIP